MDGTAPAVSGSGRPPKRVTIRDIAARAGASRSAVSIVLNGQPGVGEDMRRRVLATAEELGWRPNAFARALSKARASAIGLVIARSPELLAEDPFFARFVAGVELASSKRDYALTLRVVPDDAEAEAAAYRRFAQSGLVDGVFLLDLRPNDSRITLVESLRLPAVAIGRPIGACSVPWLAPDESAAVDEALDLLLALGHRNIAHVSGDRSFVHGHRRARLWRDHLRRAGVTPGRSLTGSFTAAGGAAATRRLLLSDPRPTAIFYANDLMAIGGINAAAELGLRVPDQLSVVGFDDIPLASHLSPSLTSVRLDVAAWGATAANLLIASIEDAAAEDPALGEAILVTRASTGPAPAVPAIPRPAGGSDLTVQERT